MDGATFGLSAAAIAVPILSFLTLLLDIPSFAWHIKNTNIPASCLVFWIVLGNLFNFVNALIWPTDDVAHWWHGEIYCDIQVKLVVAATLGIVGAVAAIMRSLAMALNTEKTVLMASTAQRNRKMAIDGLLCFGLPIYAMLIHYIVQPSRFYIFTIGGCTPSFDNSWPSLVLVYIWPPILCLVDAYYCVLVIIRVQKYRKSFAAILTSSNSGLTKSRFLRLFFVSLILLVIFLPVQCYIFYRNAAFPLQPYSWSIIHGKGWWNIFLIPTYGSVTFDRWVRIALGFTVFFCFGLGQDAMTMYRIWLLKMGLGKIFPRLRREQLPTHIHPSSGSRFGSYGSKARDFITRKFSYDRSTGTSRNPSTDTALSTPSPTDPKKTFQRFNSISEVMGATELNASTHTESTDIQGRHSSPSAHGALSWITIRTSCFFARDSGPRRAMQTANQHADSPGISVRDWSTSTVSNTTPLYAPRKCDDAGSRYEEKATEHGGDMSIGV